jgi:hypothetical protein
MDKNILLSKTFYLGVISAILPLFPVIGTWISANQAIYSAVVGGLIIGLRLISNGKITIV